MSARDAKPGLASAIAQAVQEAKRCARNKQTNNRGLQDRCYALIAASIPGARIKPLVEQRLEKHIPGIQPQIDEWASLMRSSRLNLHVKWSLLRTVLGAWTTSCRMHENSRLPCVFGCDAEDAWGHYCRERTLQNDKQKMLLAAVSHSPKKNPLTFFVIF